MPTKALLVIRFTLATVCVGLLLATRRARRASLESNRLALGRGVVVTALALSAAVCYSMQARLYLEALHHMDAALLALISYTYPTFVMLAAIALRQDHFTRGRAAALVFASVGMLLVLQSSGSTGFTRLASSWPSALTYTVYILVSDTIVDRMPALPLCALVMAGAATALAVQALLTGSVEVSFGFWGWLWVVCIALVSTVLAMAFFFAGLRRTGPSTAAILSTFEPVVTTALAGLVLSQIPTFGQVLGDSSCLCPSCWCKTAAGPNRNTTVLGRG